MQFCFSLNRTRSPCHDTGGNGAFMLNLCYDSIDIQISFYQSIANNQ
ncbi:hypothetical protein D083_0280 [Dickeya solani RNS 08.23.3.1.A]|nr:hypothetical protein D083_0280 [Dickeya solani RNS 08.23.3.1.A]